jgi:hypothetical protein
MKRLLSFVLLAIAVFAGSLNLQGQSRPQVCRVSGYVTNGITGQPSVGITVLACPIDYSTGYCNLNQQTEVTTDENGYYLFSSKYGTLTCSTATQNVSYYIQPFAGQASNYPLNYFIVSPQAGNEYTGLDFQLYY